MARKLPRQEITNFSSLRSQTDTKTEDVAIQRPNGDVKRVGSADALAHELAFGPVAIEDVTIVAVSKR